MEKTNSNWKNEKNRETEINLKSEKIRESIDDLYQEIKFKSHKDTYKWGDICQSINLMSEIKSETWADISLINNYEKTNEFTKDGQTYRNSEKQKGLNSEFTETSTWRYIEKMPTSFKAELVNSTEEAIKDLQSMEVLFVMDVTSSMGHYIDQCKECIKDIEAKLQKSLPECEISWGFLGYRDFNSNPKFEILNFTENVDHFRNFVTLVKPKCGGDVCEDVTGAFEESLKFHWTAQMKIIFFITDAPNHGSAYYKKTYQNVPDFDDHPKIDINKPRLEDFVKRIKEKKIFLFVMKINEITQIMFDIIENYYNGTNDQSYFSKFKATTIRYGKMEDSDYERMIENNIKKSYYISRDSFQSKLRSLKQTSIHELPFKNEIKTNYMNHTNLNSINEAEELDFSAVNSKHPIELYINKKIDPNAVLNYLKANFHQIKGKITNFSLNSKNVTEDWKIEIIKNKEIEFNLKLDEIEFQRGSNKKTFFCSLSSQYKIDKTLYLVKKSISNKDSKSSDGIIHEIYSCLVADNLSTLFNSDVAPFSSKRIDVLISDIIKIGDDFFIIEEFLPGEFKKYNNNFEYYCQDNTEENKIAQCFSHWTFEKTSGKYLIHDLQGVKLKLTDLQITTTDSGHGDFGSGNLGVVAIIGFLIKHKCNEFCKNLKLKTPEQILNFYGFWDLIRK